MVNIAVFAAFAIVNGRDLSMDAVFKGLCGPQQLDIAGYGRQKRQETAMMWQRMAGWVAKTAPFGGVLAASTLTTQRLRLRVIAISGSLCDCQGASGAG